MICPGAAQELAINQHLYELPLDSPSITNLVLKGLIFRLRMQSLIKVALLQPFPDLGWVIVL